MSVRIVIVDDDMDDILLLNEIFSVTEYAKSISFFHNPEGVIPYLDSISDTQLPSLILSDLNMPKLNGFELLEALKINKRYQRIPVVIYTTSNSEKEKRKALSLGARDFITKPVQSNAYHKIIDKIREVLEEGQQR
jgi:CheY-like chemotaxis protein